MIIISYRQEKIALSEEQKTILDTIRKAARDRKELYVWLRNRDTEAGKETVPEAMLTHKILCRVFSVEIDEFMYETVYGAANTRPISRASDWIIYYTKRRETKEGANLVKYFFILSEVVSVSVGNSTFISVDEPKLENGY
jgi:hypothetical protein